MTAAGLAARRAAWEALRRVHADDAWASPAVDAALQRAGLDARDRAFAANLAFETLRWEGTLDWLLATVVTRDLTDVEPGLLDVLRMGAWQHRFGRVPDRAMVDTSVELARAVIGPRATGFTNGVLRGLVRTDPPLPHGDDDAAVGLAVGYPPWIVAVARERFGPRARTVLEAGNTPPGLVLRARGDRAALLTELRGAGVREGGVRGAGVRDGGIREVERELTGLDARPGSHPQAVRVPQGVAATIDAVREGRATVQDEASMHVVTATLAAAGPGALVVDACAGPGGKTTGLVEGGARVVATDVHPIRAQLVADLVDRGEATPAHGEGRLVGVVVADATRPSLQDRVADAVLVDAPCTGLGVVRRRPELRWRRRANDPDRLARLQRQLLDAAVPLVRPGGALVYSVCTWPVAETREVVERFVAAHPGWRAERPQVEVGTVLGPDPGVQLAPDLDDTDGMYIAVLRHEGGT